MKALVLQEEKQEISCQEVATPSLGAGQVLVNIKAAALNHRDVYITQGLYPGVITPIVLGSDGAGVVVEVGAGVDKKWLNQSVCILIVLCKGTVQLTPSFVRSTPTSRLRTQHLQWIMTHFEPIISA